MEKTNCFYVNLTLSNMKKEATGSAETLVNFYTATQLSAAR